MASIMLNQVKFLIVLFCLATFASGCAEFLEDYSYGSGGLGGFNSSSGSGTSSGPVGGYGGY